MKFNRSPRPKLEFARPILDGFRPEKNNCTVTALATVLGVDYGVAFDIAEEAGRKPKRGFKSEILVRYFNKKKAEKAGYKFHYAIRSNITVQKFCKRFPTGRFYVRKKGHAFAIVDGTVFDRSEDVRPLTRIIDAWRLEPLTCPTVSETL